MVLAYGIVLAKKRNLVVNLEPIPFPSPPSGKPLEPYSGQAPPLRTFNHQAIPTAGKGKLEVLGKRPGHLVAQGTYIGKAVLI